jgi:uncharacterized integral membrane protein
MIRLLLVFLIIVFYLILVIYNTEEQVILKYALGYSTQPLPIYLVILVSFLVGMFLAAMLTLPGWIHTRIDLRKQRRTIEQMDRELNRLATISSREAKSEKPIPRDEARETEQL